MPLSVDIKALGILVKTHRRKQGLTLREAAKEAKVSAATLSRIENNNTSPDLRTVEALVTWVNVPIEQVVVRPAKKRPKRKRPNPDLDNIEVQFRADPNLKPEAAEALIEIMRTTYEQFARLSHGA